MVLAMSKVLYACGREFVPSVHFLPITWNGIPPCFGLPVKLKMYFMYFSKD